MDERRGRCGRTGAICREARTMSTLSAGKAGAVHNLDPIESIRVGPPALPRSLRLNQLDFQGRTAIVTGGAQGIGLAIAERLLASGAKVRIWDRDEKLLAKSVATLGASASGDTIDVTSRAALERGTKSALEALGRIDVLVNNA